MVKLMDLHAFANSIIELLVGKKEEITVRPHAQINKAS